MKKRPLYKIFNDLYHYIKCGNKKEVYLLKCEIDKVTLSEKSEKLYGKLLLIEEELESNKSSENSERKYCGMHFKLPDLTGGRKAEGGLRISGVNKESTKNSPLVSVVTVVYNNDETLVRCMESVFSQKYDNVEYIVVDGGSDDKTLSIIEERRTEIDYYVSEPDSGIYSAMNKGLSLAKGKYICILNSDDWYAADFISSVVKVAEYEEVSIVTSYFSAEGVLQLTSGINEGIYLSVLNLNHASFLVKSECYDRVGFYSEKFKVVSDLLWIQKAYTLKEKYFLVKKSFFNFSHGGLSSGNSEKRRQLFLDEICSVTCSNFSFLSYEEASDIYALKFNKKNLSKISPLIRKYKNKSNFISSISKYVEFCFTFRDNFIFEESDLDLLPLVESIFEELNLTLSILKAKTKIGCLSEVVKVIDEVLLKKCENKKTIIHYVFNFSTPSETFIYDLVNSLDKGEEYDNFVLYDNKFLEKERPYEKSFYVPWDKLTPNIRELLYKYIFKKLTPDVLVAHFSINGWKVQQRLSQVSILLPSIYMTHGIDIFSLKTNKEYKDFILGEFVGRKDSYFTTVSSYLKKSMLSQGIPEDKISLVHNSVHERFFEHRKKVFNFKPPEKLKILCMGRCVDWKGHLFLLDGLKYFIDFCYKNVELTIVYGKGKDYLEETKKKISVLGLESTVNLIPFVNFDVEKDYFSRFDIFILPSTYSNDLMHRSETFGMVTLEAIASGLPVMVTNAGGSPEVIGAENSFARIVPHGNGKEIGLMLEKMFLDKKTFGNNLSYAKERLSHFSREKQLHLLSNVIEKAIKKKVKVALFTSSTMQGAGYAAFRVHRGLVDSNIDPILYTKVRDHEKFKNVNVVSNNIKDGRYWNLLQDSSISKPGLTIFSINYPFISKHQLSSMVKDVDVVNVHWAARFLSVENIAQLSNSNKPLVITIRDMNPITGGCHFFHGCDEWKYSCNNCQQLVDNFDNLPKKVLDAKRKNFNFKNITIVTLSEHSANIIKEAPFFKDCRLEIIPNSIETDVFKPMDKIKARKKFGLPLDRKIICYVPSFSSTVKGYDEIIKAFELLDEKYSEVNPFILLIGNKTPANNAIKFDNKSIGYINDNESLAAAYSAADLTVVPSLEETFSNTTAESISCGTPVVGFKTGAIPDMVTDGVTGYTYEVGDCNGLADGIYKLVMGINLSSKCRYYAENNLRFNLQAKLYENLFFELAKERKIDKLPSYKEVTCFSDTTPTLLNILSKRILSK